MKKEKQIVQKIAIMKFQETKKIDNDLIAIKELKDKNKNTQEFEIISNFEKKLQKFTKGCDDKFMTNHDSRQNFMIIKLK